MVQRFVQALVQALPRRTAGEVETVRSAASSLTRSLPRSHGMWCIVKTQEKEGQSQQTNERHEGIE